jgi:hypothetical protein
MSCNNLNLISYIFYSNPLTQQHQPSVSRRLRPPPNEPSVAQDVRSDQRPVRRLCRHHQQDHQVQRKGDHLTPTNALQSSHRLILILQNSILNFLLFSVCPDPVCDIYQLDADHGPEDDADQVPHPRVRDLQDLTQPIL